MKIEMHTIQTNDKPVRIALEKPELYDRIFINDLYISPHDLFGIKWSSDNLLKSTQECWIPIDYKDAKEYDIVIERWLIDATKFIIIKLQDEMRKDLR